MKLWIVVWVVVAIIGLTWGYPQGQSTLVFGFWPSNHFYIILLTLFTLVLGMVFAYDNMYKMNPPELEEEIERTGGLEIAGEEAGED